MDGVSIYSHIPFCYAKCGYCDFFSVTDYSDSSRIIQTILDEFSQRYSEIGLPDITTVFIGGGTPNSLSSEQLSKLLHYFDRHIDSDTVEFTVESNPEFITPEYISILNDSPVNRISIGVQSFHERELSVLQRNTTVNTTISAVEIAARSFHGDINIDLMCEIPGQSAEKALKDIEIAAAAGADHISRYTLTIEPGTPFYRKYGDSGIHHNEELFFEGAALLEQLGYRRYEVSNFAKPGKECAHNIHYWHMDYYLGIGPGAVSTLPGSGALSSPWKRIVNPPSIHEYFELAGERFLYSSDLTEILSWKELLFEHLMMGLRLVDGFPLDNLYSRFPNEFHHLVEKILRFLEPYTYRTEKRIALTDNYFNLQNHVLSQLLSLLEQEEI